MLCEGLTCSRQRSTRLSDAQEAEAGAVKEMEEIRAALAGAASGDEAARLKASSAAG